MRSNLLLIGLMPLIMMVGRPQAAPAVCLEITNALQRTQGEPAVTFGGCLWNASSTEYSLVQIGVYIDSLPADSTNLLLSPAAELVDHFGSHLTLRPGEYSGPLLTLESLRGLDGNTIVGGALELTFEKRGTNAEPLLRLESAFRLNPPRLTVSRGDDAIQLRWMADPEGLAVQSTTNVHDLWSWRILTNDVAKVGSDNVVTITADSLPRCYRLCKP